MMGEKTIGILTPRRAIAAWAALLLICLSQLGYAAHESAHDADSLDHCEICAQLDRSDEANAPETTALGLPGGGQVAVTTDSVSRIETPRLTYSSRGPPLLL